MSYKNQKYYDLVAAFFKKAAIGTYASKQAVAAEVADYANLGKLSPTQIRRMATEVGRYLTANNLDKVIEGAKVAPKTETKTIEIDEVIEDAVEDAVEDEVEASPEFYSTQTNDEDDEPMSLTVTFVDGSLFSSRAGDRHFKAALRAVEQNSLTALMGVVAPARVLAAFTASYKEIVVKDGQITFCGQLLKGDLVEHILDCIGAGRNIVPLMKALHKLEANPNPNVRANIWSFISKHKLAITVDGDFTFYKHIEDDYFSWYTRGVNPVKATNYNNPEEVYEVPNGRAPYFQGTVVEQDRDLVDPDPEKGCSVGLHVGCYGYHLWIGCRTMVVTVDPADIVAVPRTNEGALRVCKLTVVGELTTANGALKSDGDLVYKNFLEGEDGVSIDDSRTNVFWDSQKKEVVEEPTEDTSPAHIDPNSGVVGQHPFAKFLGKVFRGENPFKS